MYKSKKDLLSKKKYASLEKEEADKYKKLHNQYVCTRDILININFRIVIRFPIKVNLIQIETLFVTYQRRL